MILHTLCATMPVTMPKSNFLAYLLGGGASLLIFSASLDSSTGSFGLRVLKSPPRCPTANAICERVIGTIRRECLDWLIPLSEAHLRRVLRAWIGHYNRGRPHMALGPGVPDPPPAVPRSMPKSRHLLADFSSVRSTAELGGLHHEYSLPRA